MNGRWALLLATGALAASCGSVANDDAAASGFERELQSMPAVSGARVEREAFDTDYWGEEIVVDMEVGATAKDVTAVLDAFRLRLEAEGQPQDARLTIGAGTTTSEGDAFEAAAPSQAVAGEKAADNARIARLLVTAVGAFPDCSVSVTPTDWSVIGDAGAVDPRVGLDQMISVVQADDLLASSKGLALTATAGPVEDQLRASLNASEGLTDDLVSSWHRLTPQLDAQIVRAVWLGPEWIELGVRAGDDVGPRQLTTEAYGDTLWPSLHAALNELTTMHRRATLTVTNHYAVDDSGGGHLEDRFLKVGPRQRAGRDRLGRTWNAEAAAYLRESHRR